MTLNEFDYLAQLPGGEREQNWIRMRLGTLSVREGIVLAAAAQADPPEDAAQAINQLQSLDEYRVLLDAGSYEALGRRYLLNDTNLLSETNTDGGVTRYTYDKLNRVTSITDPEGAVTQVGYDANSNITKVVQADGKSITYSYDARNQLVSYVDPEGYTFSFTYDGNGNITSSTNGNGNTTRYTYDGLDRITQRTDEEGGVATQTFDADGRLIKTVDEEGAETSYAYDACGRVVKMTDALGNSTTYTYDELDRLLTATDAKGGVTTYTYTDRGDVATVTDAEGYVTSYEYDGNQNLVKLTTPDGVTTYEYDPLDRLIKTTTPDGKSEHITYNGEGDVTSKTDKAGHKTSYVLDACGRIVETIDALGNSTLFEYDPMGRLTKTSLHRVDAQDKVDEWEITLYEYDGRGLVTKETNALGAVTAYAYDGNGNLVSKKDADGYETKYTYNALDFVTQINYNGGKQASYRYNKVGELVEMEDWTGTTSFEVDLLRRITQVTDRKGNVVEYGYDEVGNQTSIDYPDGTGVDYAYDLLGQLKTVTEGDGRATAYSYDGMGRVVRMEYPHGWVEDYVYDSIGQLLRVDDTDPTRKDMKQQKHVYKYDDCGNMVYEYMRGNGTGEATTENTYTYDALHRLTRVDEVYGKAWREYQYDSLGNLTYERNSNNVHYDYKLNNLNQITQKTYSSNDKEGTLYTYDGRGNLVLEQYGKLNGNGNNNGNGQRTTVGQYTYDETNKMVLGVNSSGESSAYLYNGLGALVEDTWKIAKNGYGYHDVDAGLGDADPNNGRGGGGSNGQGNGNGNGQGNGNGSGDKPTGSLVTSFSTVVKQFVVDYTSPTFEPLMEHEVNGLDYRYVYGNDRLSVNITGVETSSGNLIENGNQLRLYYHMDYLGTTDYLTSPVSLKVTSWTHYNEWGEITHNAVLKSGKRELDLVKRYATHDYDAVLGLYYAKARFYDAENRRFAAVDPVKGEITNPLTMVQYLYVLDNPLRYIDPDGRLTWPGQIHDIVKRRVAAKYSLAMEQTIYYPAGGQGRADLLDTRTGEIWDVKPKSCSRPAARRQVLKYVNGRWKNNTNNIALQVGRTRFASESFIVTLGIENYQVDYWPEDGGLIIYQYKQITNNTQAVVTVVVLVGVVISILATGGASAPAFAPAYMMLFGCA